MTENKCPYHHKVWTTNQSESDSHVLIRLYVEQFRTWVLTTLSSEDQNFAEKQQALFAYRILQLSQDKFFFPLLQEYASLIIENSGSYKEKVDDMKQHLQETGEVFFRQVENDNSVISRLVAWLETFNAFLKRVVITSYSKWETEFPYKLAVQFASTSLERANKMAIDPDIEWWKWLFFDPDIDISKLFPWMPTTRPVYKCPVLYSWEFRKIIDEYYKILCALWESSSDKPADLNYF